MAIGVPHRCGLAFRRHIHAARVFHHGGRHGFLCRTRRGNGGKHSRHRRLLRRYRALLDHLFVRRRCRRGKTQLFRRRTRSRERHFRRDHERTLLRHRNGSRVQRFSLLPDGHFPLFQTDRKNFPESRSSERQKQETRYDRGRRRSGACHYQRVADFR